MSNYFTLFSTLINDITPEERSWVEAYLAARIQEETKVDDIDTDDVEDAPDIGFAWSFEKAHDGSIYLHLYSEEYGGDVDKVADFVQAFLAAYRPDDVFKMEFANTGDSPGAIDAFGGGAVIVTAAGQRWMNTGLWLAQQESEPQ